MASIILFLGLPSSNSIAVELMSMASVILLTDMNMITWPVLPSTP